MPRTNRPGTAPHLIRAPQASLAVISTPRGSGRSTIGPPGGYEGCFVPRLTSVIIRERFSPVLVAFARNRVCEFSRSATGLLSANRRRAPGQSADLSANRLLAPDSPGA